jgi:hypothetical protein
LILAVGAATRTGNVSESKKASARILRTVHASVSDLITGSLIMAVSKDKIEFDLGQG